MNLIEILLIYLKGIAMGAADVVPGVSGGTIAFITGIYDRLIFSLRSVSTHGVTTLFQQGPVAFWKATDATFLLVLLAGIVTSIFALASGIHFLLQYYPQLVWSFFFGLILISGWMLGKSVDRFTWRESFLTGVGIIVAAWISSRMPTQIEPSMVTIFLAGSVAICAMILPGISGSFILLLLGLYEFILNSVRHLDVLVLVTFVSGCVIGLLTFVHVLGFLLQRFRSATLALLTGFMLGSLVKVWPWKQTLSFRTNSHGEMTPLYQKNVWPGEFEALTQQEPYWIACILLALAGFSLVLVIEKIFKSE